MELIAQRREARRLKALREKAALQEERKTHGVDLEGVRFARMVEAERDGILRRRPTNLPRAFTHDRQPKVAVMVRKRPLNPKESALKAIDVVTCLDGGHMVVHEPKTSVDCTRRVESSAFSFDRAFGETSTNAEVYHEAVSPLVKLCLEGGGADATCFAYGQTGSGKTHTMTSCYARAARDIAAGASSAGYTVWVSFFDIYGGKCYDLLRERRVVQALEDAKGRVRVVGLRETRAEDASSVLALADAGASCRKTSRTDSNSASSRSHSIFQMTLRSKARGGRGGVRAGGGAFVAGRFGRERTRRGSRKDGGFQDETRGRGDQQVSPGAQGVHPRVIRLRGRGERDARRRRERPSGRVARSLSRVETHDGAPRRLRRKTVENRAPRAHIAGTRKRGPHHEHAEIRPATQRWPRERTGRAGQEWERRRRRRPVRTSRRTPKRRRGV